MVSDLDTVLDALHQTLQDIEYRVPYTPPPTWPLYECDHEWNLIASPSGFSHYFCSRCGDSQ